jgi:hypothetical protein
MTIYWEACLSPAVTCPTLHYSTSLGNTWMHGKHARTHVKWCSEVRANPNVQENKHFCFLVGEMHIQREEHIPNFWEAKESCRPAECFLREVICFNFSAKDQGAIEVYILKLIVWHSSSQLSNSAVCWVSDGVWSTFSVFSWPLSRSLLKVFLNEIVSESEVVRCFCLVQEWLKIPRNGSMLRTFRMGHFRSSENNNSFNMSMWIWKLCGSLPQGI